MRHKLRVTLLRIVATLGIAAIAGWLLLPKPRTALHHPLHYYLSLPSDWASERTWPIVVVVDGVNHGHFLWSFLRFQQARHRLPFILISPVVVSNSGHPDPRDYPYSPTLWSQVDHDGAVPFDAAGVLAIVDEVQQTYHGEPTFYLTGWSAGGHLAWYLIFTHPERLAGVVLAGANYAGRGVSTISTAHERVQLPIYELQGGRDPLLIALNAQWAEATTLAAQYGYSNITHVIIPDGSHNPFPDQVFEAFSRMRINTRK